MRGMMWIRSAVVCLVLSGCAGTKPPLPETAAELLGQDGAGLFNIGDFDGALRCYRRAFGEAQRIDNPALQARYRFNTGRIFYECALYDSALNCFGESAGLFTIAGRSEEAAVAGIFEVLVLAFFISADSAALLLPSRSADAGPDNDGIAATVQTIVSMLQGDLPAARRYSDRAMASARQQRDPFAIGGMFYYQAMIAFAQHSSAAVRTMLDSSLLYYSRSPVRYRNWKSLLGRSIVDYCDGDTVSGERFYLRAKKAAPNMVAFPGRDLVRNCPEAW